MRVSEGGVWRPKRHVPAILGNRIPFFGVVEAERKKTYPLVEKVEDLDVLRGPHQLKKIKSMDGKERDLTCRPNATSREMGGGGGTKATRLHSHKPLFFVNP
jgi:hypothetical protein